VVYLTSGERGDSSISPTLMKKIREEEASKVMSALGVRRYCFLGLPDGKLEDDPTTIRVVSDAIAENDGSFIYVPNGKEPHKDHRAACRIITEALQSIASKRKSLEIRYYEVWGSLDMFNLVIDISSIAESKRKVIRMYQSQLKYIKYDEQILSLNRRRGTSTQKGSYCEVYDCYRIYPNKIQRIQAEELSHPIS
jgi:LmbE family N-acetylglucosaminyl deacetylase